MKILIAIDSFKGSMTSVSAGDAARDGVKRVYNDAEVIVYPLADGGEGTVEALTTGLNGSYRSITVSGPLGRPVLCRYGILKNNTAVMEMSAAAGITLVSEGERDPLEATTYGVGEMIADGIANGCRDFIIGIGGSATNDGGIGMLQALGFGILDKNGKQVPRGAKGLRDISRITADGVIPELHECTFSIACDVTNPLCGENGCSAVYGPQKGADEKMIRDMDGWLESYARLIPDSDKDFPGTGAAGGMGFAFRTFLKGRLVNGVELILQKTGLEKEIASADIVITGEGRLDSQSAMGKAPVGVAALAKKYGKPVIAFAGAVTPDARTLNDCGIDAFFPIVRGVCTLEEAMKTENAKRNMTDAVEQALRLIKGVSL